MLPPQFVHLLVLVLNHAFGAGACWPGSTMSSRPSTRTAAFAGRCCGSRNRSLGTAPRRSPGSISVTPRLPPLQHQEREERGANREAREERIPWPAPRPLACSSTAQLASGPPNSRLLAAWANRPWVLLRTRRDPALPDDPLAPGCRHQRGRAADPRCLIPVDTRRRHRNPGSSSGLLTPARVRLRRLPAGGAAAPRRHAGAERRVLHDSPAAAARPAVAAVREGCTVLPVRAPTPLRSSAAALVSELSARAALSSRAPLLPLSLLLSFLLLRPLLNHCHLCFRPSPSVDEARHRKHTHTRQHTACVRCRSYISAPPACARCCAYSSAPPRAPGPRHRTASASRGSRSAPRTTCSSR